MFHKIIFISLCCWSDH